MDGVMLNAMFSTGSGKFSTSGVESVESGSAFAGLLSDAVKTYGQGNMIAGQPGNVDNTNSGTQNKPLTFEEKVEAIQDELENCDEEVLTVLKKIIMGMFTEDTSNNAMLQTNFFDKNFADSADIMSKIGDMINTANSDDDVLSGLASTLQKIFSTDDQDTDNNASLALAAMICTYCPDTDVSDRISEMAKTPDIYSVDDIVSYANDNDISNDVIGQFAKSAEQFLQQVADKADITSMSFNLGQQPPPPPGIQAPSVSKVNVSAELSQIIGDKDSETKDNVNDFAGALMQHIEQMPASEKEPETTEIFKQVSPQVAEKIIAQLSEAHSQNSAEQVSELKMLLNPHNLGEVAIKLVSDHGTVSVLISAANSDVAKALSENLPSLSQALTNKDVDLKNIQVIPPEEAHEQMGFGFQNQQSFAQFSQNQNNENARVQRVDFNGNPIEDLNTADMSQQADQTYLKGAGKLWATA